MNHKSVDILAVVGMTIIAIALAFAVSPDNVFGRILTLPLVLVLPGYALTSALFARRTLGGPERLVFSLGLSLMIVVMVGLVLNGTRYGLSASSWSLFLSSITLIASAVALVRRRGQSISTSGWFSSLPISFWSRLWSWLTRQSLHINSTMRNGLSPTFTKMPQKIWLMMRGWVGGGDVGLTFRQGLLLGLAVVVVFGAVAVSVIGAVRQPFAGFTQLWLLPTGGAGPQRAVHLGVSNMELTAMEYSLNVSMDGQIVKVWDSIDLKPNEKWEATLMIPQTSRAGAVKVEALLYRSDAPMTIYRHVTLWLGT